MSDTDNLKIYIQKMIEIDDEEDKYKNILSKIKNEKENLNNNIIKLLEKNNITDKDIIYGNKKIKYGISKVQDSITKKLIEERLKIFLKDEILANNATNFIYSKRHVNEKPVLKISNIKLKKSI